jgi:hypothetical protein
MSIECRARRLMSLFVRTSVPVVEGVDKVVRLNEEDEWCRACKSCLMFQRWSMKRRAVLHVGVLTDVKRSQSRRSGRSSIRADVDAAWSESLDSLAEPDA